MLQIILLKDIKDLAETKTDIYTNVYSVIVLKLPGENNPKVH